MPKKPSENGGIGGVPKSLRRVQMSHFFREFRDYFTDDFFNEFDEDANKREKFLETYELTCGNVSASCAAAEITRRTYNRWLKSDAPENVEFRRRLEEIKPGERLADIAELVVLKHLENGSLDAAKMVLFKNKHLAERGYYERQEEKEPIDEKEFKRLRLFIQKTAADTGTDYKTELEDFLKHFGAQLAKSLKEKLEQELKNINAGNDE